MLHPGTEVESDFFGHGACAPTTTPTPPSTFNDTLTKNTIECTVELAPVSLILCSKEMVHEVVKTQLVCHSLMAIVPFDLQPTGQAYVDEN